MELAPFVPDFVLQCGGSVLGLVRFGGQQHKHINAQRQIQMKIGHSEVRAESRSRGEKA